MSKVWAGVDTWALEAERAEDEERELAEAAVAASIFSFGNPTLFDDEPSHSFPSLKEAATKPKKKGVTLTLSGFTTGTYVGLGGGARKEPAFEPKGLTPNEMLRLPSGPRECSAEELENTHLGSGFRSNGYRGSGAAAPPRRRPDFGMDDESRSISESKTKARVPVS